MKNVFKTAVLAALAAFVGTQAATTYGPVTIDSVKTTIQKNGKKKDTTLVRAIIDGTSDETLDIPEDIVVNQVVIRRKFTAHKPQTMVLPFDLPGSWRAAPLSFWRYAGMLKLSENRWQFWTVGYSGNIEANTPFVVVSTSDVDSVAFNLNWMDGQQYGSVTMNSTKGGNMVTQYSDWKFVGTYSRIDWEKGHKDLGCVYGFSAKNKDGISVGQFVKAAPSDTSHPYIRGMRGYLHYSPAKAAAKRSAIASGEEVDLLDTASLPQTIEVLFDDTVIDSTGDTTGTLGIGRINPVTGEMTVDRWVDMKGRKLEKKPTTKGVYYNNRKKVIIK